MIYKPVSFYITFFLDLSGRYQIEFSMLTQYLIPVEQV